MMKLCSQIYIAWRKKVGGFQTSPDRMEFNNSIIYFENIRHVRIRLVVLQNDEY